MNGTPVTYALLVVCGAMFGMQTLDSQGWLVIHLALWPLGNHALPQALGGWPEFMPWQLLSYGFLHGGPEHLFFNSLGLWMFGRDLERFWGSRPFLLFVLVAIVGAGLAQLAVASLSGEPYPTVGISGGVYGVLLPVAGTSGQRVAWYVSATASNTYGSLSFLPEKTERAPRIVAVTSMMPHMTRFL